MEIDLLETPSSKEFEEIQKNQQEKKLNEQFLHDWGQYNTPVIQEQGKKSINLILENHNTQVLSFKANLSNEETFGLIRQACQTQEEDVSHLVDMNNQIISVDEIDQLINKGSYKVYFNKIKSLQKENDDNLNPLNVEMAQFEHSEMKEIFRKLQKGISMIKLKKNGELRSRIFQITPDFQKLIWFSNSKTQQEAQIMLKDVLDIKVGQRTQVFRKYQLEKFQHLSFSIMYSKYRDQKELFSFLDSGNQEQIDLICLNVLDFDLVIAGIKCLLYELQNKQCSKNFLFSHSAKFRDFYHQKQYSLCLGYVKNNLHQQCSFKYDNYFYLNQSAEVQEKQLQERYLNLQKQKLHVQTKLANLHKFRSQSTDFSYCSDILKEQTNCIQKSDLLSTEQQRIQETANYLLKVLLEKFHQYKQIFFCKNYDNQQQEENDNQKKQFFTNQLDLLDLNQKDFQENNNIQNKDKQEYFRIDSPKDKSQEEQQSYYRQLLAALLSIENDIENLLRIVNLLENPTRKINKAQKFFQKMENKIQNFGKRLDGKFEVLKENAGNEWNEGIDKCQQGFNRINNDISKWWQKFQNQ